MSVRIPVRELSDEQTNKIIKTLTITSKIENKNKFSKGPPVKFEPIQAFTIHQYNSKGDIIPREEEDKNGEDYINIPFFISKKILTDEQYKKYSRSDYDYPIFDKKIHPYCEKLRDDKFEPLSQAKKHLDKFRTTSIKLPPGYGKTIFGAALSWIKANITLVLIETKTLIPQHYNSFINAAPSLEKHIWRVGLEKMPENPYVIICMEERMNQIPSEIIDNVGTLIIDEAHKMCTPSRIEPLLRCRPKNIIILTATLGRKDKRHNIIYAIAGTHSIFKISNKKHRVCIYDTQIKIPVTQGRYGPDFSALQNDLYENHEYNKSIIDFILNNLHRKFIVLVSLTRHVKKLVEMAREKNIECDYLCDTKNSYSDSKVLFGTFSKIGTGFDEANFCPDFKGKKSDTLIIACSISAKITVKNVPKGEDFSSYYTDDEISEISRIEQIRGRVMRSDDPCIVYFSVNHPTHKKHIRGFLQWVPIVNGTIIKADINDEVIL